MIKLHDTLSHKSYPVTGPSFSMYSCGPTVYAPLHVGNARSFVTYRLLAKYLSSLGIEVTHVSNITDVNEKIVRDALSLGIEPNLHAKNMEELYKKETSSFGLGRPDQEPRASEYLAQMIKMIEGLISKNLAYVTEKGNVYFRSKNFSHMGELSGRINTKDALTVRKELASDKQDPADFALWKASKNEFGTQVYASPWGEGVPGWHIECSAMALETLGQYFDMHGGGIDLIFPHHEAERAQSMGLGHKHAKFWWHGGLVTTGGIKGSKTDGNLPTLGKALDKWGPETLLLFYMSGHPQKPLEWSEENIRRAQKAKEKIQDIYMRTRDAKEIEDQSLLIPMHKSLESNFNLPAVLALLHTTLSSLEEAYQKPDYAQAARYRFAIQYITKLFGLEALLNAPAPKEAAPQEVIALASQRLVARENKEWDKSDNLRDQINQLGWQIKDTKDGFELSLA